MDNTDLKPPGREVTNILACSISQLSLQPMQVYTPELVATTPSRDSVWTRLKRKHFSGDQVKEPAITLSSLLKSNDDKKFPGDVSHTPVSEERGEQGELEGGRNCLCC